MPSCENGFWAGVEVLGELDILVFGFVSACSGDGVEAFGELDMLMFGVDCSFSCESGVPAPVFSTAEAAPASLLSAPDGLDCGAEAWPPSFARRLFRI